MLTKETIIDLATAKLTDEKTAEHLAALSLDCLTVDTINDFVSAVKDLSERSIHLSRSASECLMDCCGTGGSGLPHFNTSTATAFVLAAGGVKVAKFGGRRATGQSGSFDFLDALEIRTASHPDLVEEVFSQTSLVFLYAPDFYPTFAKLAPIRQKLGVKTIFNVIGPLLNPASPDRRFIGTQGAPVQSLVAQFLNSQPSAKHSCVVSASSGLDELDPNQKNLCLNVTDGIIRDEIIVGNDMGDTPVNGLTTAENVTIFFKLVESFDDAPGYFKRLLLLNAGKAFEVSGLTKTVDEGQTLALDLLRSGRVADKYHQVKNIYAKHSR
jgi:anthranilate phosphoribosyltransferase